MTDKQQAADPASDARTVAAAMAKRWAEESAEGFKVHHSTRDEEMTIARAIFTPDELAEFEHHRHRLDVLSEAVDTNTPSDLCTYDDPRENLAWCRLGVRIHELAYENFVQRILAHVDATASGDARRQ
jgi:hypothetical protein